MHKLGDVSRHWHESLELLFVLSGEVSVLTGDQENVLQMDDMLLINSNVIHELHSEECVLIAVQIKLSKFDLPEPMLETLYFDCNSITHPAPEYFHRIKRIITAMLQINTAGDALTLMRGRALAYELLSELVLNFKADKPVMEVNTHKHLERMNTILHYINEHYSEQLTLSALAEREHLSAPYLSSFFEKYMGVNFSTYYTNLRLEHALHDLLYTDISVEQVALNNGFSDPRAYVRAFKKRYNTLPSEYRKSSAASSAVSERSSLLAVNYLDFKPENYFHILSQYLHQPDGSVQPSSSSSNIKVLPAVSADINVPKQTLKHHWKKFIGVARAKDLIYGEVQEMLRQLQQTVCFSYVRFHGIFSDDMMVCQRNRDGRLQFNFTLVDKALDFILSIGLKPLIQFSFMPAAIARDPNHTVFANPVVVSMPSCMDEWNQLVYQFLMHIRLRYGKSEMQTWLFSVWNEPDTSMDMFGFADINDYFKLYQNTWHTTKSFDPALKFGTPSLFPATEDSYKWLRSYLRFTRDKKCPPEFLDVHYYSDNFLDLPPFAATFSSPARCNADSEHFSKFLDRLDRFTDDEGLSELPVYITEWNWTVSHRNLINDTCFKASYLIKNFLENYDRVQAIGYWALSDFLDESLHAQELFHGGVGLFTTNGIPKPSYHAMAMLSRLGDTLIDSGSGYFITRRKDESIAIILYNYEHCNPLLVDEGLGVSATSRNGVFSEHSNLDISLTLNSLPASSYRIRETILNEEHGSCFDTWVGMGAPELGPDDVRWLKANSSPAIHISNARSVRGTLQINAILSPHEVRLVELNPSEEGCYK